MPFAHAGQYLRIDLTARKYRVESVPDEQVERYLLGSGLAARWFYDEMDATRDPLDPASPLMMLNGLLAGTFAPTGCRSSWCGRSPLTGIWNESNMGGHFGAEVRFAGYDGFVITGRASRPTYLWIEGEGGRVEFRSAEELWGLDHFETFDRLRAATDPKAQIACIGPAGENLVRIAGIMQGGHAYARTAGRGGMGALLGSKNLKAIVVRGGARPAYPDPAAFNALVREQNGFIKDHSISMSKLGTAGGTVNAEQYGGLPIHNWREGNWEGAKEISGQRMAETVWKRHTFCYACPIGCGKQVEIKEGAYAGTWGEGPEYETVGLLGSNLLNADLPALVKANDLCNRYGLDTVSTGATVAFAFEAFEKGLLTRDQCNGLDLTWGNSAAILALIEAIAYRRGVGELLADGVNRAAQRLGPAAAELNLTVKGLEFPAHDPRAFFSMGINYATANRGACHLEGLTFWNGYGIPLPDLGYPVGLDSHDSTIGARIAVDHQNYASVFNPLGLCKFIIKGQFGPERATALVNTAMGWRWTPRDLLRAGERLFNLKRLINGRYGISREDDTLPLRFRTQPRPTGKSAGFVPDVERMLADYYALREWTPDGRPSAVKLKELGLS